MKLWTFGDSFTNYYIDYNFHDGSKSWYTQFKEYRGGTFPKIWPEIVSEKLNLELINMSKGGSSNYDIFFKFCETSPKFEKNDLVIVGWTFVTRFIHVNHGNLIPINDANQGGFAYDKQTVENILINRMERKWNDEVYSWMILMDCFAKQKEFKLFYWSADRYLINGENKEFKENKKFIFSESNEGMLDYLRNNYGAKSISDETNHEIKDPHFGEMGHIVMGEKFYEHIKDLI